MNTINFGIDLGTTNSVIARHVNGKTEVFKNPVGHKETLPSVVAFRKDRIIVGDKAREYMEKDPANVIGSFKRRMGTSETFFIPNISDTVTPVMLSAAVLKELKNFVYTGERVDAAVITIPASFDTIQSNATKKAGYDAGFDEVLLLQEPIAASLAFANSDAENTEGQWLVYDLGGGTFDVALIRIRDGEMKIVDHQGDNFLGGLDFDMQIIESIVVPKLEAMNRFDNLADELRSARGRYHKLYYRLLLLAEDAKVQLSSSEKVEIEFEITDRDGEDCEIVMEITRAEFEQVIFERVNNTMKMILEMLERNSIAASDLKHILMIGGSTYIPLVRRMASETLGISVNCNIDPTTAVAIGAACYAGTRSKSQTSPAGSESITPKEKSPVTIRTAYQKTSPDTEEYFAAAVEGSCTGLFYRITRDDGGFDSGIKPLAERISEYLPLSKGQFNSFTFRLSDDAGNPVPSDVVSIGITQGKYNVIGQPLPNDICLEVDDLERNITKMELVFEKNSILPLRKTITKSILKTIKKDSDDHLIINVIEGSRNTSPGTNPSIGIIRITGKGLQRDLIKGSDIEITIEISESRDLRISTYLVMTDQETSNLFNPSERHVDLKRLRDETNDLLAMLNSEVAKAEDTESYEKASQLAAMRDELYVLNKELQRMSDDDTTDRKYQVEDRKRKIAQLAESLTIGDKMQEALNKLSWMKMLVRSIVNESGTAQEKTLFEQLLAKERMIVASGSPLRVREYHDELSRFGGPIQWRSSDQIIRLFHYYGYERSDHSDPKRAKQIVATGEKALERQNYDELRVCVNNLRALLPREDDDDDKPKDLNGTGIG